MLILDHGDVFLNARLIIHDEIFSLQTDSYGVSFLALGRLFYRVFVIRPVERGRGEQGATCICFVLEPNSLVKDGGTGERREKYIGDVDAA
jgi:hypothetical protein